MMPLASSPRIIYVTVPEVENLQPVKWEQTEAIYITERHNLPKIINCFVKCANLQKFT